MSSNKRTVESSNENASSDNGLSVKYDAENESATIDVADSKKLLNSPTAGFSNWLKSNFRRLRVGILTSFKDLKMFMW